MTNEINVNSIMKWFESDHLPVHLKEISQEVQKLAVKMNQQLPDCDEKYAGLRKLLEAKDALVRAAVEKESFHGKK